MVSSRRQLIGKGNLFDSKLVTLSIMTAATEADAPSKAMVAKIEILEQPGQKLPQVETLSATDLETHPVC